MVQFPDVALVIQGPMNDQNKIAFTVKLDYYKQLFGEIILSTYTEHLENSNVEQLCEQNNIKLVTQSINIGSLNYKYNIGYQTVTTLEGLKAVTKKYVIKHRTDEYYSNLHLLVEKLLQNDQKWVSGTTIFGKRSYYLFHAADHLFCGLTEKLLKTFQLTKDNLQIDVMERNYDGDPAAEVTFTKNFIRISGEEPDNSKYAEQMIRWFDFVLDKQMWPFLIRFNHDNGIGSVYSIPEHGFHATRNLTTIEQAVIS